jgi:hypothetical protein
MDVDTIKNDWLTDNVRDPGIFADLVAAVLTRRLQVIAFWEEYKPRP